MDEPERRFDPAQSSDPLAQQVAWGPLYYGGASYRTHYLKFTRPERARFVTARRAQMLAFVVLFAGIGFTLGYLGATFAPSYFAEELGRTVVLLFGLLFVGGGAINLYMDNVPIVFDKSHGYFWKNRKRPKELAETDQQAKYVKLDDIHAIQLLAEMLLSRRRWFRSYELNLVLNSGERVNVVDHSDLDGIRDDADQLAKFLGVPVWDVIEAV